MANVSQNNQRRHPAKTEPGLSRMSKILISKIEKRDVLDGENSMNEIMEVRLNMMYKGKGSL